MIRHTWLQNPLNFGHVPSNLLSRSICDSFASNGVIKAHPNDTMLQLNLQLMTFSSYTLGLFSSMIMPIFPISC
jgi:hypothetical protein